MPENEFVKIEMSGAVEAEMVRLKEENSKLVTEYEKMYNMIAKYKSEIKEITKEKELLKELAKNEAMKRIEEADVLKDIYDIYDED